MRDAKYYLTIEKQERQPHKLPRTEPDAHVNGLEDKTQDSREIFHYAPLNGSFAKRIVQVLNGNRTMVLQACALAVDPCAKRRQRETSN